MKRTILYYTLPFLLIACNTDTKSGAEQQITIHISETHLKVFNDLEKKIYSSTEAAAVLATMSEKGNRFCDDKPAEKTGAQTFLKAGGAAELAAEWPKSNYAAMVLGCRNWYTMSDMAVANDFIRINAESANTGRPAFDCYSVGFLQPYIMAANLNCNRLNIVDADFRIIKAHVDFLNLIKNKPTANIRALVSELKFSFAAGGPAQQHATDGPLTIADLCGKNSETHCLHYLMTFVEKFSKIKEINLILSPLHEFRFLPDKQRAVSVFYTSNAFDPNFTTEKQFEEFRTESGKIAEDTARLIIYHQSEEKSFGIYKLNKTLPVSTVCADKYRNVVASRYSPNRCRYFPGKTTEYDTYFDKISVNHQIKKYCSDPG